MTEQRPAIILPEFVEDVRLLGPAGPITTAQVAMTALRILRESPLMDGVCQHPAEALRHDDVCDYWICPMCGLRTTDESVARCIADPRRPGDTWFTTIEGEIAL